MLNGACSKFSIMGFAKLKASLWFSAYLAFLFWIRALEAKPWSRFVGNHGAALRARKSVVSFLSVIITQVFTPRRFATNHTCLTKPAFSAKSFPVCSLSAAGNKLSALFARIGSWLVALEVTSAFCVMSTAQTKRTMLSSAKTRWFNVILAMLFSVFTKNKVIQSVVGRVSIFMVNLFFGAKVSTNMFLHNKPVLENISIFSAKRVMWYFNANISLGCFYSLSDLVSFLHCPMLPFPACDLQSENDCSVC